MNDCIYSLHGIIQGYHIEYITFYPFYFIKNFFGNKGRNGITAAYSPDGIAFLGQYPDNISAFCESAKLLSNFIDLTVCIHTTRGAAISDGHESLFVDSIVPSKIDIVSGAGDSWDAAFIFGHLYGFTTIEKICFANLLSSLHVGNLFGDNPSLSEIIDYIESTYF